MSRRDPSRFRPDDPAPLTPHGPTLELEVRVAGHVAILRFPPEVTFEALDAYLRARGWR